MISHHTHSRRSRFERLRGAGPFPKTTRLHSRDVGRWAGLGPETGQSARVGEPASEGVHPVAGRGVLQFSLVRGAFLRRTQAARLRRTASRRPRTGGPQPQAPAPRDQRTRLCSCLCSLRSTCCFWRFWCVCCLWCTPFSASGAMGSPAKTDAWEDGAQQKLRKTHFRGVYRSGRR